MPQLGQILCYYDWPFEDGSKGDKLFVVLNVADSIDVPCLVLKTTSQSKRYEGARQGCNPHSNPQKRVFFIPLHWQECLPVATYIQLAGIIEIPTEELLQGALSKGIRMKGSLSTDCFAQLKNCLKQFKEDISPQHWILIFKS